MPVSKRSKVVSLTQTSKKGRQLKAALVEKVRDCVEEYSHVYVFRISNMRNRILKEMREHWASSRIFLGKNRVMAFALGRNSDESYKPGLNQISERLRGDCGLLFTNSEVSEVLEYFEKFEIPEFARAGFVADREFTIPAGPLQGFQYSMEPTFRQLGLETRLEKGVITLLKDHTVCRIGDALTPEQGRLLKLFDQMMAVFKVHVQCVWTDGKFTELSTESSTE